MDAVFYGAWRGGSWRVSRYLSDPANPVPYRQTADFTGRIPRATGGRGKRRTRDLWRGGPDVLTFVSAPLEKDLVVTGPLAASLFASSSGTDSDFVVKLIDVYPQTRRKMRGKRKRGRSRAVCAVVERIRIAIAMEVRRGRYLKATNMRRR